MGKTIEKPSMSMVNLQKNIQWWWSGGSKTIEKPSLAMVPWRKNITIASFDKNDHRWSLAPGLWYRTTPFSSANSSLALRWQWQFSQTGWQFSQNQAGGKNQANLTLILAIWSYNSKYIILQLKIYVPTTQNILKYILIYFLSLIISDISKIWVPASSKVSWSGIVSLWKAVF